MQICDDEGRASHIGDMLTNKNDDTGSLLHITADRLLSDLGYAYFTYKRA